jgi:FkbM family methyltransferase
VFEPNPVCLAVLSSWAAGKGGVNLHPVALSNCQGAASLQIPIDASGVEHDASASIERGHTGGFRDQEVELRTLDSYWFDAVTLIKIDVEGHEYSVIEGAVETIRISKPALLVEIEKRHIARPVEAIFDQIFTLGYCGYFLENGRLKSLQYFDEVRHQVQENLDNPKKLYINNFLFLPRDRIAYGEYEALLRDVSRI